MQELEKYNRSNNSHQDTTHQQPPPPMMVKASVVKSNDSAPDRPNILSRKPHYRPQYRYDPQGEKYSLLYNIIHSNAVLALHSENFYLLTGGMLPQPPVAQVAPSVDMTSQRQPACSQPQQQMSPRLPPQSPVTSSHQMSVNPAASGLPVNPQPQPASHHHQQMSPVAGQMSAAQIIGSSQLQLQAVSSQSQIMSPQVGCCYFKSVEVLKENMLKCIEVDSWYFISDAKCCWTSSVISPTTTATTTTTTGQPNPQPISGINAESHCPISIARTITPQRQYPITVCDHTTPAKWNCTHITKHSYTGHLMF